MRGLREVRVAAEPDAAETRATAEFDREICFGRRAFVARPVAAPIDNRQDFARVRQRQDQRVITPRAVVRDIDTFLLLAAGFHQRAVHIENRFGEE